MCFQLPHKSPRLTTIKEIWDHARSYKGSDMDNWHLFGLFDHMSQLVQGTISIADYWELCDVIDYYASGEQTEKTDHQITLCINLLGYLNALNPTYADICRNALHRQEGLPDLNALIEELTEEESHSKLHPSMLPDPSSESSALLSHSASITSQENPTPRTPRVYS